MSRVIVDISVSLDGFIRASGETADEPLGKGGEQLHDWGFSGTDEERALLRRAVGDEGSILVGRRTYDDSIRWWGSNGPTGQTRTPTVVVTHKPPASVPDNSVYTFVSGIAAALEAARTIAGAGIVGVGGGASVIQQLMALDLVDGIHLHVVPVLFGGGLRLFDAIGDEHRRLELRSHLVMPAATHLLYDFVDKPGVS